MVALLATGCCATRRGGKSRGTGGLASVGAGWRSELGPERVFVREGHCPGFVEGERVELVHLMPPACPGEAHVACYIGAALFSCPPWRRVAVVKEGGTVPSQAHSRRQSGLNCHQDLRDFPFSLGVRPD